ncbi:MAG: hypothetical protein A2428_13875 [Bdellovibrionales bacterium RIFOXYC1_FULL_54_43]|nr:MAG: hypothetical protein A2428_13875 [Bdellovibrionales bacterium RIFOXYC1_FULL_54_43]OFZ83568.1 MAG: hypothetical protein A2603_02105 [Bdellovibrionales bacterium RIFOXYD1_FULL_55_31]
MRLGRIFYIAGVAFAIATIGKSAKGNNEWLEDWIAQKPRTPVVSDFSAGGRYRNNQSLASCRPAIKPSVPIIARTAHAGNDRKCTKAYSDLYSNGELNISIFFGYDNDHEFVDDGRYQRADLEQLLTRPPEVCARGVILPFACGFKRDPDDASSFVKPLIGPDRKAKRVRIRLISSSVTSGDLRNRVFAREQADLSERVKQDFERALRTENIVFYSGHARDGGGPDFFPPRLNSDQKVDYAWYRKRRPGLKGVLSALNAQSKLVFGIFACDSNAHFRKSIKAVAPKIPLILTNAAIPITSTHNVMIASLNAVLGMKCRDAFLEDIQFSQPSEKGSPVPVMLLDGFPP